MKGIELQYCYVRFPFPAVSAFRNLKLSASFFQAHEPSLQAVMVRNRSRVGVICCGCLYQHHTARPTARPSTLVATQYMSLNNVPSPAKHDSPSKIAETALQRPPDGLTWNRKDLDRYRYGPQPNVPKFYIPAIPKPGFGFDGFPVSPSIAPNPVTAPTFIQNPLPLPQNEIAGEENPDLDELNTREVDFSWVVSDAGVLVSRRQVLIRRFCHKTNQGTAWHPTELLDLMEPDQLLCEYLKTPAALPLWEDAFVRGLGAPTNPKGESFPYGPELTRLVFMGECVVSKIRILLRDISVIDFYSDKRLHECDTVAFLELPTGDGVPRHLLSRMPG